MSRPRDILPLDPVSLRAPESLAKGDLVRAPQQCPRGHSCWGRMMPPAHGDSPSHGPNS